MLYSHCDATSEDILYESLPLYHSAGSLVGVGTAIKNGLYIYLCQVYSILLFPNNAGTNANNYLSGFKTYDV